MLSFFYSNGERRQEAIHKRRIHAMEGRGSIKSVSFLEGGSQKCSFVDKREGVVKNGAIMVCESIILMPPRTQSLPVAAFSPTDP